MKLNLEDLKKQISSQIKAMRLNDILDQNTIDTIAMRLKNEADYDLSIASAPKGILPENEMTNLGDFSAERPNAIFPEQPKSEDVVPAVTDVQPSVSSGEKPTDVAYQPDIANKPIIPYEIQSKEPVKLFVFEESELVQNGEGLASKAFKTIENPNVTKSMYEIWMNEANLKAEMYIVKYERVGEINYDYTSNSATLNREMTTPNLNTLSPQPQNIDVQYPQKGTDLETIAMNAAREAIKNYQMQTVMEEIKNMTPTLLSESYEKVEIPKIVKENIDWAEGQIYASEDKIKMLGRDKNNKYTAYVVDQKDIYIVDNKTEDCFSKK